MHPIALALALLIPLVIDCALLAEVVPEVLVAEESSKEKEKAIKEIQRLTRAVEEAEEAGNDQQAIEILEQILTIQENILGPNHSDVANNLNWLGNLYRSKGVLIKAESIYKRALTINKNNFGSSHINTLEVLTNLGKVLLNQGLYKEAEINIKNALVGVENTEGPDSISTATTLVALADVYSEQSRFKESEELYKRSLEIYKDKLGAEKYEISIILHNLADMYRTQGLYSKAEIALQQSLSIAEKILGRDHPNIVLSLTALGELSLNRDLYSQAESYLRRALVIQKKIPGLENRGGAFILNNLGLLYLELGLHSKAEPLFQESLLIHQKIYGFDHPNTLNTLNNLALIYSHPYSSENEKKKAEKIYQQIIESKEKAQGSDAIDIAIYLSNLARLYHYMELYQKSEQLAKRSIKIQEKSLGEYHSGLMQDLDTLSWVYMNQGLFNKAESQLNRALEISKKVFGVNHLSQSYISSAFHSLYEQQGLYEKAIPFLRKMIEIELTAIQRESPYLALSERKRFRQNVSGSSNEISYSSALRGKSGAHIAMFSRLNNHGLLEELEERQAQLASLPGPQQEIAQQLREATQNVASTTLTDEQRKKLSKRKEELEKKLYRILPELKPRLVEVEQVANAIPLDGILLEYQRYQPFDQTKIDEQQWEKARYLALTLNSKGKIEAIDLGLAEPIEDKIQQALTASEEGLEDAQQLWEEVGKLVIKPLANAISDNETLFISPDAELNRIPFAALSSHKDGQLLSDAVDIRLLTTGRELLDLAKFSKSTKQKPLVIANPAFNLVKTNQTKQEPNLIASNQSQKRSGDLVSINWDPLPGTAKEGKVIAKLINAQLLTKDNATALALQEKEAPKVLHIASHAYYLPDKEKGENPLLRSGIVLAGANEPEINPKDDGYLTALEVAKVDWQDTELVVISGCDSGKGDIQSGEGVYGLKRAIAVAGARSSVLSLWKVDDIATAAFMKSFYERLKAGEGRADALAATQKDFRNHSIPGWRHPYVWAAFQLSGDWRPIDW